MVCPVCKQIRCGCTLAARVLHVLPTRVKEGWDDGLLAKLIHPPEPCRGCALILKVMGAAMLCPSCDPDVDTSDYYT